MPRILRRLPYVHSDDDRPQLLTRRGRRRQIVLHLGIAPLAGSGGPARVPPPDLRPVPVVLDTGFTHGLLLRQSHLTHLCLTAGRRYAPGDFPLASRTVELGRRAAGDGERVSVRTRHARVWFYPNVPGSWAVDPDAEPIFLPLPHGVIIAPADDLTPHDMPSPLLGLCGMSDCDLFALTHAARFDMWTGRPWWWRCLQLWAR